MFLISQVNFVSTTVEPEQETVSSTQQFTSDERDKRGSKVATFYDASSDKSSETENSLSKKIKNKKLYKRRKKVPDSAETNFDKSYICRFCDRCCKTKREIVKHIKTHPSLLSTYRKFIERGCSVTLNRTDNKPNLCNSERIVVHDCDRFLNSEDNFYYTVYRPKPLDAYDVTESSPIEIESLSNTDKTTLSSDSEPVRAQNRRKRRRLISGSSNETVVVEKNNVSDKLNIKLTSDADMALGLSNVLETNDDECINIDDSSDTASCKSSSDTKNNPETNNLMSSRQDDLKTIQKIISVCFNKYYTRLKSVESDDKTKNSTRQMDSSLKHKVLSFGRKIINSPGVSCVGILRYLEHQNLEIVWIPRLPNSNKKSDPVQIMMKLKSPVKNDARDYGWIVLHDPDTQTNIIDDKTQTESPTTASFANIFISNKEKSDGGKISEGELEPAVLLSHNTTSDKDTLLKKLLNTSPVLNPKHLHPKKASASEFQEICSTGKNSTPEIYLRPVLPDSGNTVTSDGISHMPKIISTRSLAQDSKKQGNEDNNNIFVSPSASVSNQNADMIDVKSSNDSESMNENTEQGLIKNASWIKVKPVSELMSNRALNKINSSLLQQNDIAIIQNQSTKISNQKVFVSNDSVPQSHNAIVTPSDIHMSTEKNNFASTENSHREYVVMDSVDLPCTKTDSPFKYLKDLLQIHNITLLDTTEIVSQDFISLLKFKLQFEQENNLPVSLGLELFCSKRRFCLKVRDVNNKDIDITLLSANWQWKILKIYTGDVVGNQLLQNARNRSVYEFANVFLCLLKGIKFQKS